MIKETIPTVKSIRESKIVPRVEAEINGTAYEGLPVLDTQKNQLRFTESLFAASELAEYYGVARNLIYDLTKEGLIQPVAKTRRGKMEVLAFDSKTIGTLGERFGSKIIKSLSPRSLTFTNVKGGTGKSTLSCQFAMTASMLGKRVCALDLDPQGHLSTLMHFYDEELCSVDVNGELNGVKTIGDIFNQKAKLNDVIVKLTPNLDIIPAHLGLSSLEMDLNRQQNAELRFINILQELKARYDVLVIDTAPTPTTLNCCAYSVSGEVIVICETDHLSVQGLRSMVTVLEQVDQLYLTKINYRVVANKFTSNERLAREALGYLQSKHGNKLVTTVIGRCQDFKEAGRLKQLVWQYNKKGQAAQDIMSLTLNLLEGGNINA